MTTITNDLQAALHDLQAALHELQRRHAILIPSARSVRIWSPNKRVPGQLRRVVYEHRKEVLRLIALSEISTCPSPDFHRHSWDYELCRYCCNICARLRPHVR